MQQQQNKKTLRPRRHCVLCCGEVTHANTHTHTSHEILQKKVVQNHERAVKNWGFCVYNNDDGDFVCVINQNKYDRLILIISAKC